MLTFLRRTRSRQGAMMLELIAVFLPWLLLSFMFFNLFVLLGSLMLNQATVNRGAQQMATLGCLPDTVRAELETRRGLGTQNVRVRAIAPRVGAGGLPIRSWDRTQYLDEDGRIRPTPAGAVEVTSCLDLVDNRDPDKVIPSGNFMFLQATYQQNLFLIGATRSAGGPSYVNVARNALVVSHALEGEAAR